MFLYDETERCRHVVKYCPALMLEDEHIRFEFKHRSVSRFLRITLAEKCNCHREIHLEQR